MHTHGRVQFRGARPAWRRMRPRASVHAWPSDVLLARARSGCYRAQATGHGRCAAQCEECAHIQTPRRPPGASSSSSWPSRTPLCPPAADVGWGGGERASPSVPTGPQAEHVE
eukprot:1798866-Alexandrium_andersonii.AAC.1